MSDSLHRRARLVDIAADVGCSVSTVSRVLSGRSAVSPELSARIHAAAHSLGYNRAEETRGGRPTVTAQVIDLVLPHFSSAWANPVVAGAQAGAFEQGYDLVLSAERDEPGADWSDRIVRRGTPRPTRCAPRCGGVDTRAATAQHPGPRRSGVRQSR